MRYVVCDRVGLSRLPEGPIASYIVLFAHSLESQGYSVQSLRHQLRIVAGFSRWLAQTGVELHRVCSEHASQYLRYRARRVQACRGDSAALQHLLDFLRDSGVVPAQRPATRRSTAAELYAQAYRQYLREVRGLAESTIAYYSTFATDFLQDRFGDGRANLSRLRASDVIGIVQRKAQRLNFRRAKLLTTALRSFLRYARYRGDMVRDLADVVPVVANWSMPSIPRAIAPDQIRQLLSSIDRRTGMGLRDYAILLLLARLGLRSGEVVSLELADIDWSSARLTVRGKCGQRSELPLHADVGKAIAAYLRHGRPHSACRRVFLRSKAPITGFRGACGVCSVVRHALLRAGIDAPTTGAHQFRHGLAADMLRHGASLNEIGES
ncbi:tyrosine-type recombinase/integrase [Paraburkholderia sp. JHI2823]|uniref:tyrosine-type recombinase/integrase n=1 Tax=Paraburkholderia sp. JHI2823 TaxID=3112960 RepID=UPI003178576E